MIRITSLMVSRLVLNLKEVGLQAAQPSRGPVVVESYLDFPEDSERVSLKERLKLTTLSLPKPTLLVTPGASTGLSTRGSLPTTLFDMNLVACRVNSESYVIIVTLALRISWKIPLVVSCSQAPDPRSSALRSRGRFPPINAL
jgi:hypothetical protein